VAWKRERGSARGYINTETGERLSRRQYDTLRELEGERKHLDSVRLASQRRAQKRYNDLIYSASKKEIERLNEHLEAVEDQITQSGKAQDKQLRQLRKDIKKQIGRVRGATRQNADVKAAVRDLKTAKADDIIAQQTPKGQMSPKQIRLRNALVRLGKRDDIPDWVPPGLSDEYRRGKLRRDRIPQWALKGSHRPARADRKRSRIKGR
jgi:hypothetical protein